MKKVAKSPSVTSFSSPTYLQEEKVTYNPTTMKNLLDTTWKKGHILRTKQIVELIQRKLKWDEPSWHIIEAWDVAGGAIVSHTTTLTPLELYPAAATIDPLAVTYVTSLKGLYVIRRQLKKRGVRAWDILKKEKMLGQEKAEDTYAVWLLKQTEDSVGWMLLLPSTSSYHVHTVPSNPAVMNLCLQWSNRTADTETRAYGGGTFAAGSTP